MTATLWIADKRDCIMGYVVVYLLKRLTSKSSVEICLLLLLFIIILDVKRFKKFVSERRDGKMLSFYPVQHMPGVLLITLLHLHLF